MNEIILPRQEDVDCENLFNAFIDLLEVMHKKGFDTDAKQVCKENGITYEVSSVK